MAGGTRGRPSKPIERKRMTGRSPGRDSGGRKLPDAATVVALPGSAAIPASPPELATKDAAKTCRYRPEKGDPGAPCRACDAEVGVEAWQRLWTAGRTWLSPTTDRDILVRLCLLRLEEAHLRQVLADDGMFVAGQRGGLVKHPAVAMLRTACSEATRIESLCGFTPSDRGRLGVGEVKHASPVADLLAKRTNGR